MNKNNNILLGITIAMVVIIIIIITTMMILMYFSISIQMEEMKKIFEMILEVLSYFSMQFSAPSLLLVVNIFDMYLLQIIKQM